MSAGALDKIEAETTAAIAALLAADRCLLCECPNINHDAGGFCAGTCGGTCILQRDDLVFDLFAGPGGWDVAAQWLGIPVVGVELDQSAVLTRRAVGHHTIHGSVTAIPLHLYAVCRGLIASPPCQTFSQAGSGSGRKQLDLVIRAVKRLGAGEWPQEEIDATNDPRTVLVLEPLRWALALQPTWLAFEQVPTVLPVWEAMAEVLREHGWFVATGMVHAEQHGVAQTRKRAGLVAHREHPVSMPTPTHSKYHPRTPDRIDPGMPRWVSMAEALDWGMGDRPSYTIVAAKTASGTNGSEWGGAGTRKALAAARNRPAWVPDEGMKMRANNADRKGDHSIGRNLGQPAQTMSFGHNAAAVRWVPEFVDQSGTTVDHEWPEKRPATVVATRDLVQNPGATANRHNGSTKSRNDGIRVTVQQAAVLQSFPADYQWQGTKSKQYEQVGNAVPPLLALALLSSSALAGVGADPF